MNTDKAIRIQSRLTLFITLFALMFCVVARSGAADLRVYTYHNPFEESALNQGYSTTQEATSSVSPAIARESLLALSLGCGLTVLALASLIRLEYLREKLSTQYAQDSRICEVFAVGAEDNVPKQDAFVGSAVAIKSKRPTCVASQTLISKPRLKSATLTSNRLKRFQ